MDIFFTLLFFANSLIFSILAGAALSERDIAEATAWLTASLLSTVMGVNRLGNLFA